MALRQIPVDWKHVKSYATEKNLLAAIGRAMESTGIENDRFVVVRTPEGRWTAIVQLDNSKGGYLGRHPGFLKI